MVRNTLKKKGMEKSQSVLLDESTIIKREFAPEELLSDEWIIPENFVPGSSCSDQVIRIINVIPRCSLLNLSFGKSW